MYSSGKGVWKVPTVGIEARFAAGSRGPLGATRTNSGVDWAKRKPAVPRMQRAVRKESRERFVCGLKCCMACLDE
jgi:hypothetical protein